VASLRKRNNVAHHRSDFLENKRQIFMCRKLVGELFSRSTPMKE
jgi:hypothetical protein